MRQRFTIAHEIGHIVLDHSHSEYQFFGSGKSWQERQADIFVSELLMPIKEFKELYFNRYITDIAEIAYYLRVSKQAAQIRLKKLNLI